MLSEKEGPSSVPQIGFVQEFGLSTSMLISLCGRLCMRRSERLRQCTQTCRSVDQATTEMVMLLSRFMVS